MKELIYNLLVEETTTLSLYTGGGDEPIFTSFTYSEDRDRETFLKEFAERLARKIQMLDY